MERYKFRGWSYGMALSVCGELWYVAGSDSDGGGGILEWCCCKEDAETMLKHMLQFPRFSSLEIAEWRE